MRHICQTMHIEISRVVATQRRREIDSQWETETGTVRERERVSERGSPLDRLSAGASPGVVSPKFHPPSARNSYNPHATPIRASLCKTRIRSDDDC